MQAKRIFLFIGGEAAPVRGSNIYCENIVLALKKLGHEVVLYNYSRELERYRVRKKRKREFLSQAVLDRFREEAAKRPIDIFFSFANSELLENGVVQEIGRSTFTINYTTNYHQRYLIEDISRYFHLSTYISLQAKVFFDSLGVSSYWLPMAANEDIYRYSGTKSRFVSFVGSAYGNRPYYLWRVLQRKIDLEIYGPFWRPKPALIRVIRDMGEPILYIIGDKKAKIRFLDRNLRRNIIELLNKDFPERIHDALTDLEMIDILGSSVIVINIPESRFGHDILNPELVMGCNLRDFEVAMSGSCLLTQMSSELPRFYEPGVEALVFSNEYELLDQLQYYAKHVKDANTIAQAGHKRARNEHTWAKRIDKLFHDVL